MTTSPFEQFILDLLRTKRDALLDFMMDLGLWLPSEFEDKFLVMEILDFCGPEARRAITHKF